MQDRYLIITIFRDLGFFMLSLLVFDAFLYKGIIYEYEAWVLVCLIFLYIAAIVILSKLFYVAPKQKRSPSSLLKRELREVP
jgi:Ca2+/Na+ antiporter